MNDQRILWERNLGVWGRIKNQSSSSSDHRVSLSSSFFLSKNFEWGFTLYASLILFPPSIFFLGCLDLFSFNHFPLSLSSASLVLFLPALNFPSFEPSPRPRTGRHSRKKWAACFGSLPLCTQTWLPGLLHQITTQLIR